MIVTTEDRLLIECDCGCSIWEFQLSDDVVFLSVYGNLFYEWQGHMRKRVRWNLQHLNGKGAVLSGICISRRDMEELITAGRKFTFSEGNDEYENTSHIKADLISLEDPSDDAVELSLIYDQAPLVHVHRGFGMSFTEEEWHKFLNGLEGVLNEVAVHS